MYATMQTHPRLHTALVVILPAILALILAIGIVAIAATPARTAAPSTCAGPVAGQHIYDCAGILSASDISLLETHAKAVEQAGAPVVVYLQVKDASYDETYDDAGNLMQRWDVESRPGAHDGLVILLNLKPGNEHHGEIALFAGEKHFQHGNLPESELQRIYDDVMLPELKTGDLTGGIAAGLDAAAHSLRYGPPVDPTQQAAASFGRLPYNVLAALLAAACLGLFLLLWPRRIPGGEEGMARTMPPDNLTPAEAGALVTGRVSDHLMEAMLLDFARRGLLSVEPSGNNLAQLRLLGDGDELRGIEQKLWQRIESVADEDRIVQPGKLVELRKSWQPLRHDLRQNMIERGWFDPQARGRDAWFYVAAALAFLGAIAGFLLAAIGEIPWPLIGFGVLLACGIAMLIAGQRYPETTEEGRRAAAPWVAYREGMQSGAVTTLSASELQQAIPYMLAISGPRLGSRFLRHSATAEQEALLQRTQPTAVSTGVVGTGYYPYWLYYGGFHSAMYPASSGSGSGGSFGGAASGGGGAGGSF